MGVPLLVRALGKGLGGLLPEDEIEEGSFLLPFFIAVAIRAIDGNSPSQAGGPIFDEAEIWILDWANAESDLVDIGHVKR